MGKSSTKAQAQARLLVERAKTFGLRARALAHQAWMKPWLAFQKFCFYIGVTVLLMLAGTGMYVAYFLNSLPQAEILAFERLQELAKKRVRDRLEDKKARYRWVALRDVSRELLYSIVVSEDATFFEHEGFNMEMILSSLAENLKEGKHAYGASTISQQVAKNLFLTNEKTYVRKLKELLITKRLEARLKKNELLELYFNLAEFGPDIFGVEAAAKHYFNTDPANINAAQGAFMALMLPSPKRNYFSIYQNRNLTKQKLRRVERVLRDMLYEEYLSEAQYRKYVRYHYFPETSPRSPARADR